ncbi:MAG: tRNA uridine-5-carboxymethylaminomethyl(34) synthesis GTPase MnmE [Bdellovibrionales bacterium]|nr:tRNA uridine-5-carboxymethylaminomethyl(34) synthesis GTPase MnmE [Bdellovibrionales bacterium]
MSYLDRDEDTICAMATATGLAGISVIRICGPYCESIVRKCCSFLPDQLESHRVYYGWFKSHLEKEDIDEVLVTYFTEGRSFTGDHTFEISCHGSPYITSRIIQELVQSGGRIAEKGEFTYRAFSNGRIDLSQAESVLSLIESHSKKSSQLALRQLKGELSYKFEDIENRLLNLAAHLEVNIDYSEEEILQVGKDKIAPPLEEIKKRVEGLLQTFNSGRIIKEGFFVALVGAPNVGKSSLLNMFVEKDKAIVTEIEGTTRDVIEEKVMIDGVSITFFDTAGLRITEDKVEKIGIEKTVRTIEEADLVCWVCDAWNLKAKEELSEFVSSHLKAQNRSKLVVIRNKIDLNETSSDDGFDQGIASHIFKTSAKLNTGKIEFFDFLKDLVSFEFSENSAQLSHLRQFELLSKIYNSLDSTLNSLHKELSPELIIFELQESIVAIHEILGKEFDDQVMDRVFKQFCLGK